MSEIKLADGTLVKEFAQPYIIAEVNSSHNGNTEVAKKMIDAAVEAGCNCVKFQSWSSGSLYSKSHYKANPIAKRFVDKLSLTSSELKEMADYCKEKKIGFSSTPYSKEEVDFLTDECDVPFIKISSMEVNNPEYIKYIANKQVPIIISTGMSDFDEVKKSVEIIESTGNKNIIILHCVSVYPTPVETANLNNILTLREMFPDYPIGYSDHTLGDTAAIIATTIGAAAIEKHITLDAKKIGMDNQMAMEPEPLSILVDKCKSVAAVLGEKERTVQPEELKQRENMRRSIVVTRDMKAGEIITEDVLDVKRPGSGMAPEQIKEILGKKLKNDIEADMLLMESDLENQQ